MTQTARHFVIANSPNAYEGMSQTPVSEASGPATSPTKNDEEVNFTLAPEHYSSHADRCIQFKPMRLEASQYPLPKIDGDPFILLSESQLKKDSGRCEAWKDEVNNLLIFVSLSSAPPWQKLAADTIFV